MRERGVSTSLSVYSFMTVLVSINRAVGGKTVVYFFLLMLLLFLKLCVMTGVAKFGHISLQFASCTYQCSSFYGSRGVSSLDFVFSIVHLSF